MCAQLFSPVKCLAGKHTRSLTTTASLLKLARISKESGVTVHDDCERQSTRKEWQRVKPKGRSRFEWMARVVQRNDTMLSSSEAAACMSDKKMNTLKQTLVNRGFCRECKPYNPPSNYQEIIKKISEEILNVELSDNWLETCFDDHITKFKMLVRCEQLFGHELPNPELHRIESLRDVCDYYSTPVRGINSYDALARNQQQLPENLHIIPEPIRFNPDFFDGLDAYPNSGIIEKRLRAKRKYPDLKTRIVWPDI